MYFYRNSKLKSGPEELSRLFLLDPQDISGKKKPSSQRSLLLSLGYATCIYPHTWRAEELHTRTHPHPPAACARAARTQEQEVFAIRRVVWVAAVCVRVQRGAAPFNAGWSPRPYRKSFITRKKKKESPKHLPDTGSKQWDRRGKHSSQHVGKAV